MIAQLSLFDQPEAAPVATRPPLDPGATVAQNDRPQPRGLRAPMTPRYTTPAVVWGDFYGLHAACAARGWSLSHCAPPRGAPCYYEVSREDGPALRFTTRDAVCDWVDEGAAEPLPLFWRAA